MTTTEKAAADPRAEIAAELFADPQRPRLRLQEWFLLIEGRVDDEIARIKEQAAKMIAEREAIRSALHWRWGNEFRRLVEQDVADQAKGKSSPKRSVNYVTGVAGFRKTPGRLEIKDAQALESWAARHAPCCLKLQISKSAVTDHIKATGEIPPGAEYVTEMDRFYPSIDAPALPAGGEA